MGFLDTVKEALKDAVSAQSSKGAGARKADDSVATPTIPSAPDTTDTEPAEPTVVPAQPADSEVPTPATPTEDVPEKRADARPAKFETYTVATGDSLPEIGARFGVSKEEIARLNNIENPDLIFPGQVFRIPKN